MKTLYLECNMGAAGDMLMAALLELHPDQGGFVRRLNELGIPKVTVEHQVVTKCGIGGSSMIVRIDGEEEGAPHHHHEEHHHHHHSSLQDIKDLIASLQIPEQVKEDAIQVYTLIAQAEGKVHQTQMDQIHFHEVGTLDAVADVVGVCLLLYELAPEQVIASPVHVGSGQVHCAHGILPVPAPATALLLQGIPMYGGNLEGELCTPTGAALLKHFVTRFSAMPPMKVEQIGYGMGKKEFPVANCLRAFMGETEGNTEKILELACNLDDMTPEAIGFATELLREQGALDVYTTSIQMKKNRPGIILTCMCEQKDRDKFLKLLFQHTTTLGVREYLCERYTLERRIEEVDTPWGKVHKKVSEGYGVQREKMEYEEVAQLAKEQKLSLEELQKKISLVVS